MYKAVTQDIQVTVMPAFLPDQSDPADSRYVWSYTIEVANLGATTVQLMTRHWIITDAEGNGEDVKDPVVVG